MSDGFKRVKSILGKAPGETPLDVPKTPKKPFVSALNKSSELLSATVKQGSEIARKSLETTTNAVKKVDARVSTLKKPSVREDQTVEEKVDKLFEAQELLFERLDSEPKLSAAMKKSLASVHQAAKKSARGARSRAGTMTAYVGKQPLAIKVIVPVIALLAIASPLVIRNRDEGKSTDVAGSDVGSATVSEVAGVSTPGNLARVTPEYGVLRPGGRQDIEFVKVSPEGNDPVYAYVDTVGGSQIRVSQQEIPEKFKNNQQSELDTLARGFQATSIFVVDGVTVYYGLSEKARIQSIIFIKDERLVFISSSGEQPEEVWVAYISALKY